MEETLDSSRTLNHSEQSRHIEKMATRAGTLTSETILRLGFNNFSISVRVGVRFPFKLLIQSRTPVSGRSLEKRLVHILYMIRVVCLSFFPVDCFKAAILIFQCMSDD